MKPKSRLVYFTFCILADIDFILHRNCSAQPSGLSRRSRSITTVQAGRKVSLPFIFKREGMGPRHISNTITGSSMGVSIHLLSLVSSPSSTSSPFHIFEGLVATFVSEPVAIRSIGRHFQLPCMTCEYLQCSARSCG